MERVQPLRNYILVRPFEEKQETAGGIVIPDGAADKPTRGKVLAIGNHQEAISVKVGETILYRPHGGIEVKVNDEYLRILRDDEVLGIIQGGK